MCMFISGEFSPEKRVVRFLPKYLEVRLWKKVRLVLESPGKEKLQEDVLALREEEGFHYHSGLTIERDSSV